MRGSHSSSASTPAQRVNRSGPALLEKRQSCDGKTHKPRSRFYYSVSRNTVLQRSTILPAAIGTYLCTVRDTLSLHSPHGKTGFQFLQDRRSPMKRLIAIVALAMAVLSTPVFAHATTFEDPTHGAGIASQS